MSLWTASLGQEYAVSAIGAEDSELKGFLLTLGCYPGAPITVISRQRSLCVVAIKDGRYTMDRDLAQTILVAEA